MGVVLQTLNLCRSFGGVVAVQDVNVQIESGEFLGIVGANGAGKTTFLNLVTGYLKPDQGQIQYLGEDITGLSPRMVTRHGIARSFQVPQLYTSLSVLENVLVALAAGSGHSTAFWRPLRESKRIARAEEILLQFGLEDYGSDTVLNLPEGRRKLLDVALSFALQPRLLLMDEPTSGVNNQDKLAVMDTLAEVLTEGQVTAVFVEHDMDVVQRYARRVLAFVGGRVVADGAPDVVLANPEVRTAVLGA